jgi:hypothetical protein
MYANAQQAMQGLKHKRSGEILPSKIIARNTKLVYLDEDCVALQFHKTFIARYERDRVVIDTRDRTKPDGWFTKTTWERIDEFTPARTFTHEGLRHIHVDPMAGGRPYAGEARLFAHPAIVSPDGSCEIDLTPEQSRAILAAKRNTPKKVKRYAKNMVKHWREWGEPLDCCQKSFELMGMGRETWEHHFKHFRADEMALLPVEPMLTGRTGQYALNPDLLANELERRLTTELSSKFVPLAIAHIAPDFPYPQTAPRRR